MIDVNLTFNGFDFSPYLSTYEVVHELEVADSLTTFDGTEYTAIRRRPVITFSLIPVTDAQATSMYAALSNITGLTTYTDPNIHESAVGTMRVASNLEYAFGLRSVDGNRYYKGGQIVLRQRTVL